MNLYTYVFSSLSVRFRTSHFVLSISIETQMILLDKSSHILPWTALPANTDWYSWKSWIWLIPDSCWSISLSNHRFDSNSSSSWIQWNNGLHATKQGYGFVANEFWDSQKCFFASSFLAKSNISHGPGRDIMVNIQFLLLLDFPHK